jgi:hypothetical protein
VLVLFVGTVNHWVTVVIHKQPMKQLPSKDQKKVIDGQKFLTYLYLMDSKNLVHLDQED